MVQKKKQTTASFYEVVFRGKPKVVRAFLAGLVMGAGHEARIFYSYEEGVRHEGTAEKLKEKFRLRPLDVHVIVDGDTSALLKKLARRIGADTGLEITSHRKVRSASMDFQFHAYARKYDQDIVAVLASLPADLKLRGYKHTVHQDPSAKGVEAYAPTHDYEASGSGTVSGPVDQLIAFRKQLADYPLVEAEEIILKYA